MPESDDFFVVEYSRTDRQIHICNSVREMLEANMQTILHNTPKDYLPVAFARDAEEAMRKADEFEAFLRDRRSAT